MWRRRDLCSRRGRQNSRNPQVRGRSVGRESQVFQTLPNDVVVAFYLPYAKAYFSRLHLQFEVVYRGERLVACCTTIHNRGVPTSTTSRSHAIAIVSSQFRRCAFHRITDRLFRVFGKKSSAIGRPSSKMDARNLPISLASILVSHELVAESSGYATVLLGTIV